MKRTDAKPNMYYLGNGGVKHAIEIMLGLMLIGQPHDEDHTNNRRIIGPLT